MEIDDELLKQMREAQEKLLRFEENKQELTEEQRILIKKLCE